MRWGADCMEQHILLHENVETMVKVMPRIEALYYFVYELAEGFHADEETLKRIKTGILDNQILQAVTLMYKDNMGKKKGKVIISIDWDKHFMLVDTDEGKTLEFDMSKSVVDNVVDWKRTVFKHIDNIIEQFNISSVDGIYTFRNKLYENNSIFEETSKIMGTVKADPKDSKLDDFELQKELDVIFENNENTKQKDNVIKRSFDCGVFEEVNLDMYYVKNV
jgi:hypothetical protein